MQPSHSLHNALTSIPIRLRSGTQLLERAVEVFEGAASRTPDAPDLKALHAKIGQQALEIDFLAGALGRMDDASARRRSIENTNSR